MRTSRLAQETAKLNQALSLHRGVRRATRSTAASAASSALDGASDGSGSALSSPPSKASPPTPSPAVTPRKRKHQPEAAAKQTPGAAKVTAATRTRVSPRKHGIKIERDEEMGLDIEEALGDASSHPRRAKREPAKRITDPTTGDVTVQAPPSWRAAYEAVQAVRRARPAPVDTVGCEKLADTTLPPRVQRYQHLVALMLSSQTKDTTTAVAMRRLRTELPPPGLTLENVLAVAPARLNELIRLVGFHNNKTRYLQAAAAILRDEHGGDVPDSAEALMRLPGVGPKMAYLCLSAAWGKTDGIGVDVHVHRITNLLGWHATKTPEETRAWLEAWLPRDKWHEINGLLVGLGQTVCLPVGRRCGECLLSEKGLCPSAVVEKKKKVKKVKKEVLTEESEDTRTETVVKTEVTGDIVVKEEVETAEAAA